MSYTQTQLRRRRLLHQINTALESRGLHPVRRRRIPERVLLRQLDLVQRGVVAIDPVALDPTLATPSRRRTDPPPAPVTASHPNVTPKVDVTASHPSVTPKALRAPKAPADANLPEDAILDALLDRLLTRLAQRGT